MNIKKKVKQFFSGGKDSPQEFFAEIVRRDGETFYLIDEETFCTLIALSKARIKEVEMGVGEG